MLMDSAEHRQDFALSKAPRCAARQDSTMGAEIDALQAGQGS